VDAADLVDLAAKAAPAEKDLALAVPDQMVLLQAVLVKTVLAQMAVAKVDLDKADRDKAVPVEAVLVAAPATTWDPAASKAADLAVDLKWARSRQSRPKLSRR
jgi:hypothetical protein